MDFTISYEPTPEEVGRAFREGLKRQLKLPYLVLSSALVAGGLVCLLAGAVSVGIGMLVAAGVAPITSRLFVRRFAARRLTYLCVPSTVRVTGDGYEVRAEQHTTAMKWSMFSEVVATPEFWLCYTGKLFTAFLPKAAFDDEQRAELEAFFAAHQKAPAA